MPVIRLLSFGNALCNHNDVSSGSLARPGQLLPLVLPGPCAFLSFLRVLSGAAIHRIHSLLIRDKSNTLDFLKIVTKYLHVFMLIGAYSLIIQIIEDINNIEIE